MPHDYYGARCSDRTESRRLDVLHEALITLGVFALKFAHESGVRLGAHVHCERCARFDVLVGLMPPHLAKPKKWNQKNPEDKLVFAYIRLDSTILHFPLTAK